MKNIFKIIQSTKEIIITYILNYLLIILSCIIYTILGYKDLEKFIQTFCPYILIMFMLLTIIYLYKKNKTPNQPLPKKFYFPLISLGISIAIFLNMIIFTIDPPQTKATIPLILAFFSSGLIGPIYEEILFRYLLYNR